MRDMPKKGAFNRIHIEKKVGIVPGKKLKEVFGKEEITSKVIREALPGQEIKNVIVSDGKKKLIQTTFFRGCLDELLAIHSFKIEADGPETYVRGPFTNINDARKAWDLIN